MWSCNIFLISVTLVFCCLYPRVSCKATGIANNFRLSATKADWLQKSCLQSTKELFSFLFFSKIPLFFYCDLEIPIWLGITGKPRFREFGLYLSHCVNLDICFSAISPNWLQVKHNYHDFYLLLPPFLHLSWRRNSLNLGQDWKVCAGPHFVTSICFSRRLVPGKKMAREGTLSEGKAAAETPAGDKKYLMKAAALRPSGEIKCS